MKKIWIYEYQAKEIKDALRMASNALNSETQETCTDRTIVRAKKFIDEVLTQEQSTYTQQEVDIYDLAEAIRSSYFKHGRDSWVAIARDVVGTLTAHLNQKSQT